MNYTFIIQKVQFILAYQKRNRNPVPFLYNLSPSMRGFEPPTYRLGGGRSILLSYMDLTRETSESPAGSKSHKTAGSITQSI